MEFREFKELSKPIEKNSLYISNATTFGDIQNNYCVNILLHDTPKIKLKRLILDYINNVKDKKWIFDCFNVNELKKLNSILKSNNLEILQKRILSYSSLITSNKYAYFLNKTKIENWINFCNLINAESGLSKINIFEYLNNQIEIALQNNF